MGGTYHQAAAGKGTPLVVSKIEKAIHFLNLEDDLFQTDFTIFTKHIYTRV